MFERAFDWALNHRKESALIIAATTFLPSIPLIIDDPISIIPLAFVWAVAVLTIAAVLALRSYSGPED